MSEEMEVEMVGRAGAFLFALNATKSAEDEFRAARAELRGAQERLDGATQNLKWRETELSYLLAELLPADVPEDVEAMVS